MKLWDELCIALILTSNSSGAVDSIWPFALGRFVAGIGGAGMTDLLSVLINGTNFLCPIREKK